MTLRVLSMFRVGFVLLTTIAILICPYRCTAAGRVETSARGEVSQPNRSCCGSSSTSNQFGEFPRSEVPSEERSPCRCVCDGAVDTTTGIDFTTSVSWIEGRDLVARTGSVDRVALSQGLARPDGIETGLCPSLSTQSLLL